MERLYRPFPWPVPDFVSGLRRAAQFTDGRRFLDVGCGLGIKLVLAKALGFEPTGIEVRPRLAALANALTGRVICIDAFEFDNYADFDVVYMYRPYVGDEDEARLERFVVNRMRPDAVLLLSGIGGAVLNQLGWREHASQVWGRA